MTVQPLHREIYGINAEVITRRPPKGDATTAKHLSRGLAAFPSQRLVEPGASAMTKPFVNEWRNVTFRPARVEQPKSVEEIQAIVSEARDIGQKIKVIGGGHSMNNIFKTDGILVDLRNLNRVLSIDPQSHDRGDRGGPDAWRGDRRLRQQGAALSVARIVVQPIDRRRDRNIDPWQQPAPWLAFRHGSRGRGRPRRRQPPKIFRRQQRNESDALSSRQARHPHQGQAAARAGILAQLRDNAASLRHGLSASRGDRKSRDYFNMLWIPDFDMADLRVLTRLPLRPRNQAALNLEHSYMKRSMLSLRLEDVGSFFAGHLYQLLPKWYGMRYCRLVQKYILRGPGGDRQFLPGLSLRPLSRADREPPAAHDPECGICVRRGAARSLCSTK